MRIFAFGGTRAGNRIVMKFCIRVGVSDVITHANLRDDRFRGFWGNGGRISHFSIDVVVLKILWHYHASVWLGFLSRGDVVDCLRLTRAKRQIDCVSDIGNKDWSACLKKPGCIGSESDCLLEKLRIFEISHSVAGLKVEKLGGAVDGAASQVSEETL